MLEGGAVPPRHLTGIEIGQTHWRIRANSPSLLECRWSNFDVVAGRDFLGPYRLVRLIRAGQSSQVWEAIRDPNPKRIAVKVLLPEQSKNRDEIEQLRHEAEVGTPLSHSDVIEIYEFNQKHELPFVAMQLFNARNLKQEIRERPAHVAYHSVEIVRRCADGLGYLHDQGWIHCDIKPDNYLVRDEEVKLIDFSIAQKMKKAGFASLLSGFGKSKIRGTRSYMSPEQIRGQSLGATSDIYSFGCMLFEIFAHRPPYAGNDPNDLLNRHLRAQPPALSAANNKVTSEFSDLVIRMLSKDAEKRPQSMTEFMGEFNEVLVYKPGMRPDPPTD